MATPEEITAWATVATALLVLLGFIYQVYRDFVSRPRHRVDVDFAEVAEGRTLRIRIRVDKNRPRNDMLVGAVMVPAAGTGASTTLPLMRGTRDGYRGAAVSGGSGWLDLQVSPGDLWVWVPLDRTVSATQLAEESYLCITIHSGTEKQVSAYAVRKGARVRPVSWSTPVALVRCRLRMRRL